MLGSKIFFTPTSENVVSRPWPTPAKKRNNCLLFIVAATWKTEKKIPRFRLLADYFGFDHSTSFDDCDRYWMRWWPRVSWITSVRLISVTRSACRTAPSTSLYAAVAVCWKDLWSTENRNWPNNFLSTPSRPWRRSGRSGDLYGQACTAATSSDEVGGAESCNFFDILCQFSTEEIMGAKNYLCFWSYLEWVV